MVGFHLVVKCLRALSESQHGDSLLAVVTHLHLLVVGVSCHLPDLDRHHVCYVHWELRLYQGGKIEIDHGQTIFTCIAVFATHILRDLSRGFEECLRSRRRWTPSSLHSFLRSESLLRLELCCVGYDSCDGSIVHRSCHALQKGSPLLHYFQA